LIFISPLWPLNHVDSIPQLPTVEF
jgi:hypothetical protein